MSGYGRKSTNQTSEKSGTLNEKIARCPDWAAECESDRVIMAAWFQDLQMGWMRNAPGIIEVVTTTPFIARWLCSNYLSRIADAARSRFADVAGVIIYPAGSNSIQRSDWAAKCGLKSRAQMADDARSRSEALQAVMIAAKAEPLQRDEHGYVIDERGLRKCGVISNYVREMTDAALASSET